VRRHAAAAGVTGTLRFNTIMLQEPPKAQLLAYQHGAGPKPERRALVWVLNPPKGDFFEAVVGLPEGAGTAGAADVVRAWAKVRSSSAWALPGVALGFGCW
jgi:Cu2+-containing amine oxidase